MRIGLPDFVSNSYFPAIAVVELGFFKAEGLDMELEPIFPVPATFEALRDHKLDFVAASSHATLTKFPDWKGAKLLAALAQHMYWFLVLRADLGAERGDVEAVKGLRIGAAPGVDLGLKRMLAAAGLDPEADNIQIAPVPGATAPGVSFGVTAAKALSEGAIDGFWANGMGAEVAVLPRGRHHRAGHPPRRGAAGGPWLHVPRPDHLGPGDRRRPRRGGRRGAGAGQDPTGAGGRPATGGGRGQGAVPAP